MKKSLILFSLFYINVSLSQDRNIEVMPKLNENPQKQYKSKKQNNAVNDVQQSTKSKVYNTLSSDRQAQINKKLKALKKKISSKKHSLKLKKTAKKRIINKNKKSNKNKRTKKTKRQLKRLRGVRNN